MTRRDNKNRAQIPNEIFDDILPHLMDSEARIVTAMARKIYGWNKQSDDIAYSQFEKMTGYKRASIMRIIERLERKGVISVKRVPGGHTKKSNNYSINLEWCQDVSHERCHSQETSPKETSPSSRVTGHPPAEKSPGDVTHQPPTKHIIPKHNTQNTQRAGVRVDLSTLSEPLALYAKHCSPFDPIANDPLLIAACAKHGADTVGRAIEQCAQEAQQPGHEKRYTPQLSKLLNDSDNLLKRAALYKPSTAHPETGPPQPDTVAWLKAMTDAERRTEFAEAQRLGQTWPEEVLRIWPESHSKLTQTA